MFNVLKGIVANMSPYSPLNRFAKRIMFIGVTAIVLLALNGCVTGPKQQKEKTTDTRSTQTQISAPASDYEKIVEKYKYQAPDPINQHTNRNTELLQLANTKINQGDCISAAIIIRFIDSSIVDETNRAQANLFKIECELQHLDNATSRVSEIRNTELLGLLNEWMAQTDANALQGEFYARLTISKAKIAAHGQNYVQALASLLEENSSLVYLGNQTANNLIWNWFSLVPEPQKYALVRRFPVLSSFATLFNMVEDASVNDSMRQGAIKRWLQQNQTSKIARDIPTQLSKYLALESIKQHRIAVLLPLSGRLSSQGEAIKNGLLAAYLQQVNQATNDNQANTEIEFIDTGSTSELPQKITAERLTDFEIVIGPLLKSHIDQVAALQLSNVKQIVLNQNPKNDDSSQQEMAELRSVDEDSTNADQSITAYFSLSPEQEAQQLVLLMRKRNIDNPVMIKDNSSIANRMATAFTQAWEETAQYANKQANTKDIQTNSTMVNEFVARPIQEISYTNNKSMRVGITAALDVLQSQRRIQQLSNLHQERIYSVTRNRRDVDAFVVFSRPDELELINPIIETSISLFSDKQLSVFATSYSFDHKQSKNSQRDLRNLVFVDMPWLIGEKRENQLSAQVDKLFNKPPSTFLRLFAFGFDALTIADNIAQLSTFKHMKIDGLSGMLSLNTNKLLNRELASFAITEDNNNGK